MSCCGSKRVTTSHHAWCFHACRSFSSQGILGDTASPWSVCVPTMAASISVKFVGILFVLFYAVCMLFLWPWIHLHFEMTCILLTILLQIAIQLPHKKAHFGCHFAPNHWSLCENFICCPPVSNDSAAPGKNSSFAMSLLSGQFIWKCCVWLLYIILVE